MIVYDLYCGLGGWAEALLAEGWDVIGFDNERHDYGNGGYPGQLVLQDVLTLHGAQLRYADLIVASPPCQEFSYRAMPWKRAKALPAPYLGMQLSGRAGGFSTRLLKRKVSISRWWPRTYAVLSAGSGER